MSNELRAAYDEAKTGEEALAALDAIAGNGGAREGLPLGDLYDSVAERLAAEERWDSAAAAQRKALDNGYHGVPDGREMLAFYVLKAGHEDEGTKLWDDLLAERADDPDLHLTAGVAFLEAGQAERAADVLARCIELSLGGTIDAHALREADAERRAALEQAGREPEAIDDHAAAALARLERQAEGAAIAVPWYPEEEFARAIEQLPGFAADWEDTDWAAYSRELDRRMRDVSGVHGRSPKPVPVVVEEYVAYAKELGLDPDWAETRARYADDRRDGALPWPPGRNDPCWCGAGAKYKRHCGA